MIGNSPASSVQRLLFRMIGAYKSADQASDSGDFVQNIHLSRTIAEQLREAAAEGAAGAPHGLEEFLEAVSRTTRKGQTPEDRELLGLADWAHRLYEDCKGCEKRSVAPKVEESSTIAAE
ncbi:hypothetical protein IHV25_01955 [Phaeovibrio sulfidiphilus]|uniref:Uncharacterized protein n=1 Tax=Phaeovibrio sulfidiphilus TaxID=1220600 RepID=A0A8J6YL02_9PROT|nr:hypothetical protein [Phaeovibrio sulfidiphilus]MBE1236418.1 hypothetical protein [Phaeovibrio sulfidiphilus]